MIVCRCSSNHRRRAGAGNMWAYLKIKAAAAWSHTEINIYCREYQMRCWWINLNLDIDVLQSQLAECTVRIGTHDWSARAEKKPKKTKQNVHSRYIAALYLKNVSFNVFFLGLTSGPSGFSHEFFWPRFLAELLLLVLCQRWCGAMALLTS